MSCQPVDVQESEASPVEPVAPCTRHEFEAILKPLIKIAKRIAKANDPEYRIEDAPLEGFDTFEIRDAFLAKIDAFVYWWRCQNATAVGEIICDKDDSKMAGILLSSAKHAKDRGRKEADPNDHPTVCAARSHLQASMIHTETSALLERTPFRALVEASKGAKWICVQCEDKRWYVERAKLVGAVRTVGWAKRAQDYSVRIDWNLGTHPNVPTVTFTWKHGKGRLRYHLCTDAPGYNDKVVSFTADRTVGRAFQSVEQVIAATPAAWPVVQIPAGEVPANQPARVACEKDQEPMSDTTTTPTQATKPSATEAPAPSGNPLIEADLRKWSLSAFPLRDGGKKSPLVIIYATPKEGEKSREIGRGKGATLIEAYEAAKASVQAGEF